MVPESSNQNILEKKQNKGQCHRYMEWDGVGLTLLE
jgi:hypothetical protein